VALDQPLAFRTVNADFRGSRNAEVDEKIRGGQPNLAAPGPFADDLAEAKPFETFREGFPIGAGKLITKDHQVATKGVLHIPRRRTDARLPVKPGFAQKSLQDPAVDVASAIMADIDDESLA